MIALKTWFGQRSKREQRLLLVMAALAVVTIVWGLVIRPAADALSSARERHAAAVIRLGETHNLVDSLRQARRAPPIVGTLTEIVRTRAEEAGFPLASIDPDGGGDGVRVAITSARGAALSTWLARLERSGVVVESAALTDNGDRTVAARLVLRSRGQ
ncbi:type II secretion system protein GspM [Sphingomonas sp. Leaf343]|uniref:type II secretion system protein GspM n=1 Tax=Sphingomonas sp. Leaf343 TaxID=1736345 RepID=UPI0006F5D102|nr:type II secretion system protein GspM [Sphingomonas sp. Leaf343]KQR81308.1 general secretion pathway protein GspM [Sphingomonas sp. Leaf343]